MAQLSYTPQSAIDQRFSLGNALMRGAAQGQPSLSKFAPLANLLMGVSGGLNTGAANAALRGNQQLRTDAIAALPTGDPSAISKYLMGSGVPEYQELGLKQAIEEPDAALNRQLKQAQIGELKSGGKPTDDMREYSLAKEQGFNGSFFDFVTEQKKASAVNITMGAEKSFDKAAGEGLYKFPETQFGGANEMALRLRDYEQIGHLLGDPNVYTGTGGAQIQALKKAGSTLLGLDLEGVAPAEAAQKVAGA